MKRISLQTRVSFPYAELDDPERNPSNYNHPPLTKSSLKRVDLYHGDPTNKSFILRSGEITLFMADDLEVAESYSAGTRRMYQFIMSKNPAKDLGLRVQVFRVNPTNPLIVNAQGEGYLDFPTPKSIRREYGFPTTSTDALADFAREKGCDCLVVNDVMEGSGVSKFCNVVIALSPDILIHKGEYLNGEFSA